MRELNIKIVRTAGKSEFFAQVACSICGRTKSTSIPTKPCYAEIDVIIAIQKGADIALDHCTCTNLRRETLMPFYRK